MNNPNESFSKSHVNVPTDLTEKPGGEGGTPGSMPGNIVNEVSASTEVVEKPGGEGGTPGSRSGGRAQ